MNTKEKVKKLDKHLRDMSGITASDFIAQYCPVLAEYAYATRDNSLNEMEKTLTHVLGMLIYYRRFTEIMGFFYDDGFNVRDVVDTFEEKMQENVKSRSECIKRLIQDTLA